MPANWPANTCPYTSWVMALTTPVAPAVLMANTGADSWGPATGAADTYKIYYNRMTATTTDQGPSVGIKVSYYGGMCINADRQPLDPTQ